MAECKDCIHYKACMRLIDTGNEVLTVCEHFNEVKSKSITPEYIEKEKVLEICENYRKRCLERHDWCGDTAAVDIKEEIEKLPTADVVKKKSMRWIVNDMGCAVEYKCSLCGYTYCEADPTCPSEKCCSKCGAENG